MLGLFPQVFGPATDGALDSFLTALHPPTHAGINFFVFTAGEEALPCGSTVGVLSSSTAATTFSCDLLPGQSSVLVPSLCCAPAALQSPPPPMGLPSPPPPSPPPSPAFEPVPSTETYMIWLSVPTTNGNVNLDEASVVGSLCPALRDTVARVLADNNLNFADVVKVSPLAVDLAWHWISLWWSRRGT